MKRDIVVINEELCNGCGACIPNCHEGALAIIDGKARLVSDPMCDGLGACIGHCPQGAISIIQREAAPYNETPSHGACHSGGCPGPAEHVFAVRKPAVGYSGELPSELSHWPIQLHLINPSGGHFRESNLVIAADCTAFTHGNFHGKYLKGQTLVIACPKLDQGLDIYKEKIRQLIDIAKVNTITVIIMEVACCRGLLQVVRNAASEASRNVPVKLVIVSIKGEILQEEWLH